MKLDLLLDTHILIWMAVSPSRIPKSLLKAIEDANFRYVSHITAIEVQVKHLKSKEHFPFGLSHLEATMKELGCTELPIAYRDIQMLGRIKSLHRDPFDRILMAQAANRDVYLATVDEDIIRCFHNEASFSVFAERPLHHRRKL